MPERIPGTNQVIISKDEQAIATDGEKILGPQTVRVHEFPDHNLVLIQGSKIIGPNQTVEGKWEVTVEGGDIEGFMKVVTKVS